MKENNKPAFAWVTFIVVIIVVTIIGLLIPKKYFSGNAKSKSFGNFKSNPRMQNTGVPGPLKWKDSFVYEKKDNDSKGQSYMQFMMEKNKK